MQKSESAHNWISSIGSLLTIIGWLTGLNTIWDIGKLSSSQWNEPGIGLTIAVFILSIGVVWGAFFILASITLAKSKTNKMLSYISLAAFIILGFAIGIIMYDSFFDLHSLSIFWGLGKPNTFIVLMAMLLLLACPIGITIAAKYITDEWACGYCGRGKTGAGACKYAISMLEK